MKGITLFALMAAGFVLFAGIAIGLSYTKYDEITTTVEVGDGITCTINGKEVSNGETITVPADLGALKVHAETDYDLPIIIAGKWTSDSKTVSDYRIDAKDMNVNVGIGKFTGKLIVKFTDDGDLGAVVLTFTIGDGITVKCGGDEIKNGDTYTFDGDSSVIVTTNDGQKHDIKYSGSWSNDYGMSGGASGVELGTSATIYIVDMMYFGDGHGTMDIHI